MTHESNDFEHLPFLPRDPSLLLHPSSATHILPCPVPTSIPLVPTILVEHGAVWSCASAEQLAGQVLSDQLAGWTGAGLSFCQGGINLGLFSPSICQ